MVDQNICINVRDMLDPGSRELQDASMRLQNLVDRDALRGVASCNAFACPVENHRDACQYESLGQIGGVGWSSAREFVSAQPQHKLRSKRDLIN